MINFEEFIDKMAEKNSNYEEEMSAYNEVKNLLNEANEWFTTGELAAEIEEYNTRFKNVIVPTQYKRVPSDLVNERYHKYRRLVAKFEELNFTQVQEER